LGEGSCIAGRIEIKIRTKIMIKTGIFGLFDGEDDLVEEGGGAAMGGDDGELAAPHGDGLGDTVEQALIGVEGEFVEGDVAALAGEGVGIGGKGIDTPTIGELEDVGGDIGVAVEEDIAEISETDVHEIGPMATVFDLETGLVLIA